MAKFYANRRVVKSGAITGLRTTTGVYYYIGDVESRSTIIRRIETNGDTGYTVILDANGTAHEGAKIHVVTSNGTKYLTTNPNDTTRDNLDSLPILE